MTYQYATFIEVFGHIDEAVRQLEDLREIDPLNQENAGFLRNALAVQGRYDEARAESERVGNPFVPDGGNFTYFMERGEADRVRESLAQAPEGSFPRRLSAVMNSREASLDLIREWRDGPTFKTRPVFINLAFWAAFHDDSELAVALLRDAFLTDGWGNYFLIWHDVLSDTRRTEAFKQFVRDLGFVEFWRQTGEWGDYCRPLPGGDDFACE